MAKWSQCLEKVVEKVLFLGWSLFDNKGWCRWLSDGEKGVRRGVCTRVVMVRLYGASLLGLPSNNVAATCFFPPSTLSPRFPPKGGRPWC
ncbi:hypothetical protein V6N12_049170 [Hibiscus sabdariffa]|uniref:Uncharacterized protein n=1 Tax=Hibiscus sabdariffa TaxID=183260 RepID=A0ABR2EJE2_9ROSI